MGISHTFPAQAGTCAVAAAGSLCLAERFYALGFGLLAGAGPGVHLGAMHVSNLFPEAKRTALGAYPKSLDT